MEIPAILYFLVWVHLGFFFLLLGLETSNKSGLSDSVPAVVMFLFGHSLTITMFHSSNYIALFSRLPKLPFLSTFIFINGVQYVFICASNWNMIFHHVCTKNSCLYQSYFLLCFYLYALLLAEYFYFPYLANFWSSDNSLNVRQLSSSMSDWKMFAGSTIFLIAFTMFVHALSGTPYSIYHGKSKLFPHIIFYISNLTSYLWVVVPFPDLQEFTTKMNKKKQLIGYAVGAIGTILFQNFFKLTSPDHVKVFIYYTIVWLATIALLRPSCGDFGIFKFLLVNVIVGCTVSQAGFGLTTWLAYVVSVVLFGLELLMKSLPFVNINGRDVIVL